MLKRLLFSICMIGPLLAGCTDDDRIPSPAVTPSSVGTVSAKLNLNMEAYGTTFSAGTRAGGDLVALSVSNKDMDIELMETPDTRAAIAAVDKETGIYTFTLLQFNGITDDSRLIGIKTYNCPGGIIKTDEVMVQLTGSSTEPGRYIKHRFVVITNTTKDGDFSSLMLNNSTYTDFQDLCVTKTGNNDLFPLRIQTDSGVQKEAMIMCGMVNAMIEGQGKQLMVTLQRTVAKVRFNITGNAAITDAFDKWDVSLMNIPNRSFYNIQGRFPVFPTATGSTTLASDFWVKTYTSQQGDDLPVNTDESYIPINLQQTVVASTQSSRRDNAPFGGTYLQIMGRKMSPGGVVPVPVVQDYVIYQIYLGNNLTTDFSVSPNCNLTYNITLKGRQAEDANVVRFTPGYFSGKLTAYDADGKDLSTINDGNAVKWKYSKKIEAYFGDAGYPSLGEWEMLGRQDVRWCTGITYNNLGATSLIDGHANTSKLQANSNTFEKYPAALCCYMGLNGFNTVGKSFIWYLPSIGELIGTWISTASTVGQLNTSYWSSTALGEARAYIITNKGEVKTAPVNDDGNRHYVRGFRDADALVFGQ